MSHQSELIAEDIDAYLAQHERKELLRFLTCGSVDDGKSTLIGRLLYDSKMIYEDQLAAVQRDSAVHGTTGGDFDPALLTDGLKAEREQGITIDVAYRYFSTARRKFIIADTPGHEQYTRNMATGASTCDLAIILVDARHGVVEQTKRHSFITSLLGIKHVLVAINKMDLVDYSQEIFEQIKSDYAKFAARMSVEDLHFIPMSALLGDNVVEAGENMPWYEGGTLMHMLETVHIASDRNLIDFRFPIQFVNRPNLDFRGFCGTIASGVIRKGDEVVTLPSQKSSRVKEIVTMDGNVDEAFAPMSITLTLEDEIDVSRGDMLVHPANMPRSEQKFDAMIVWMDEKPLVPGKQYAIKHTSKEVAGTVDTLRYRVDVNTLRRQDSPTLKLNEIGRCHLTLNQPIMYDGYRRNRATGAFIVMDRLNNTTVAAGMILDRVTSDDQNDYWDDTSTNQHLRSSTGEVTLEERSARFGQRPLTLLLTGLTGSGKTTLAYALERRLFDQGRSAMVVDGQNLRLGLNKDLGFSQEDRSENLRRTVEVSRLLNAAGMISICAFVAPNRAIRQRFREAFPQDQFMLVHLAAPIEVCRERDSEGMYAKAESGEVENFPGVSIEYEPPRNSDLTLSTDKISVEQCVDEIMELLTAREAIA
ncbi:MAG: sulfate adenylyltransferase subunit CysN [Planctomycetaceae bacterium]|nr:sulfate adenylyltransferase subunit CysN [Planctomycetaceae bacterium]